MRRNLHAVWLAASLLAASVDQAPAQSATEHHVWQDARSFQPYSRTATAITGPIALSGNPNFATKGSTMSMTFGTGARVGLTQVGAAWRVWDLDGVTKRTAEIYQLSNDPGSLINGNWLCDAKPTKLRLYVVFSEGYAMGGGELLQAAVFRSAKPPVDINSKGLCGTYNYYADPA